MQHRILIEADSFAKALKDSALYVARDNDFDALAHVLLTLTPKSKSLSVIACDGRGYYERMVGLMPEKGLKPSLPGKPMVIFIPRTELSVITKNAGTGTITMIVDEASKPRDAHAVKLCFADGASHVFKSPANLDIPDYASIKKQAEKGKSSKVSLGQAMLPIQEMLRAGKVFPVKSGMTIPMYVSEARNGGCLTLLEYQAENVDMRVIFMLSLPQAA